MVLENFMTFPELEREEHACAIDKVLLLPSNLNQTGKIRLINPFRLSQQYPV